VSKAQEMISTLEGRGQVAKEIKINVQKDEKKALE